MNDFATRCFNELDRLDIAVLNAGVGNLKWNTTADGYETMLQVNALSTGLLGVSLLPLLAKTAIRSLEPGMKEFKPHLTIVSSGRKPIPPMGHSPCGRPLINGSRLAVYSWTRYTRPKSTSLLLDLNDPKSKNSSILDRYNITKFLDVLLARQFSSLLLANEVVVDSVDPGLCESELRRDLPWPVAWFFNKISWTTSEGAKSVRAVDSRVWMTRC